MGSLVNLLSPPLALFYTWFSKIQTVPICVIADAVKDMFDHTIKWSPGSFITILDHILEKLHEYNVCIMVLGTDPSCKESHGHVGRDIVNAYGYVVRVIVITLAPGLQG